MPKPDKNLIAIFYEIEQQKLLLDFKKIELFTRHPGSLGTFRERRLRQYLRDNTPNQLTIGSGFISRSLPLSGNVVDSQSRQVDCLVFDEMKHVPHLRTDDYTIISPDALYAATEIKSSLTLFRQFAPDDRTSNDYPLKDTEGKFYRWAGSMVDAFNNIKSVCDACQGPPEAVFTGVFSYGIEFKLGSLYHAFDNGELQRQLGLKHVDELPGIICVPGKAVIVFSGRDMFETCPHHDKWTSFINVIETVEESSAYALQFFTTLYYNQIHHKLRDAVPERGGRFSANNATIKYWSRHFDLNSEGYEDQ